MPRGRLEIGDFRGVFYFPVVARYPGAFADGTLDISEVAAPPMTLSLEVKVSDAIDQFQVENQELALVTEADGVVGMVTVTDCLESVMGDMADPIDTASLLSDS